MTDKGLDFQIPSTYPFSNAGALRPRPSEPLLLGPSYVPLSSRRGDTHARP